MIYATAGHVDHGKTSLIKSLTKVDTDRLPEEKQRGLSIDLGFAYADLGDGEKVGFVDVPGHERFVRTMVAGVGSIDAVLFVIALDDGPMPQTFEHLAILSLMGIARGVVVYTKMDRVENSRVREVQAAVRDILSSTFLKKSEEFCVSTKSGEGISELKKCLLDQKQSFARNEGDGYFRLAIDRSFSLKGAGRVVTGSVFSGQIQVGQTLRHLPTGKIVKARELHTQGESSETGKVGQRCAINLSSGDLGKIDIHRGDWVVSDFLDHVSRKVHALVSSVAGHEIKHRMPVHVHQGAADVTGRIFFCDDDLQDTSGQRPVLIIMDRGIHAVRGDRFVLRDQSAAYTVGGGIICDPEAESFLTRQQRCRSIKTLGHPDIADVFADSLENNPTGLDVVLFKKKCNVTEPQLKILMENSKCEELKINSFIKLVKTSFFERSKAELLTRLNAFHKNNPSKSGAAMEALTSSPGIDKKEEVNVVAMDSLVTDGAVERIGNLFKTQEFLSSVSDEFSLMWLKVRPFLEVPQNKIPVVHDLAKSLKISPSSLERHLKEAVKSGYLVKVSEKRYFLPEVITILKNICRSLCGDSLDGQFTVAQFRDRTGIGRNAVIEILEFFDLEGTTLRKGNCRILRRR